MIPKTDVAQVINQVKTVPEGGKRKFLLSALTEPTR